VKARINPLFLQQTTFDSRAPLGSAVVVHRFEREGVYAVEVDGAPSHEVAVAAGEHATFRATERRRAGAFVARRADDAEPAFDSSRLTEADVFALTLVRPGTYAMRNELGGAEGRIVVTYPVVGDAPYRPPAPAEVTAAEGRFAPDELVLGPGQGIIFRIATPSRIRVELLEPDDGPPAEGGRPPAGRRRGRPAAS
jgi:hypothetical protein